MTPFADLPRKQLEIMASDPAYALEIGRASEHLVVADLITQGYRAFLTDQGLPYVPVTACSGTVSLAPEPEPGRFGYTIRELESFAQSFAQAVRGKPRGLGTYGRKAEVGRGGQLALLAGGLHG